MGSSGCPDIRVDGRRRNAKLRGEGVGLDYRPSPRQLRRSSQKRMMLRSLAEPFRVRGPVPVCGTARQKGTKSAPHHIALPHRHDLLRAVSWYFTNHGGR
ncbi:hypothetical protein SHJG_4017 [Streptomyces hygroscopicus subsp. jinggangensis 5008]|nr:hypothetical protein SHJG_4017 [Streptomyces hygroscopicus subsp. jinggangensis 5008]AGF63447.1 hypothetical protein SHJGH_3782 [Streptomyces hygroscopicus subsp. jinggangensis TL01]